MTTQEQRFHAAVAAMQGILANPGGPIQANGMSGWGFVNCNVNQVADVAVGLADALLAELDRTAPKPQPDADGWIAHDGGPQPCPDDMRIVRKYRDGSIYDDEMTADKFYWFHDGEDFDIVAWKPADK